MTTDRKAYMAQYMRQRRQKAKEGAAPVEGEVNEATVSNAYTELAEARFRAIIREEVEAALAKFQQLLTGLPVNTVNNPVSKLTELTGLTVSKGAEPRTVVCLSCGKEFVAIRANAAACSRKCGKRIWTAKRKAAGREA